MPGSIALHGGGEFQSGDEPFLEHLIGLAPSRDGVTRVVVVPTAAARGRPGRTARDGTTTFERVAAAIGRPVLAMAIDVVDRASAMDERTAHALAEASVIHLPGGDPDIIPELYPGSRAWAAIQAALAAGAVLAGASAGAMALGALTWTPGGVMAGLGLVPGVLVVPHVDARSWGRTILRSGVSIPPTVGVLGLAERTAVVITPGRPWLVVGAGEARWLPPGVRDPGAARTASHSQSLDAGPD